MKRGLKVVKNDCATAILFMWIVTTVSPMKRGLKVLVADINRPDDIFSVTTVSPMKRGLKVDKSRPNRRSLKPVTTVSPMKRGLKEHWGTEQFRRSGRYNRFPDEKGTESRHREASTTVTTVSPMKRGLKATVMDDFALRSSAVMLQPFPR